MGGIDNVYTTYEFTENPVQMKHQHTDSTRIYQTELYNYGYDNMGRLLKTTHQSHSQNPVILVDNQYDELGRLQSNKRNGDNKLRTDYAYNLRSWTKSITGELFNQKLYYNDKRAGGTNTSSYAGNISAMDWSVLGENKVRGYDFTYDGLSRLTAASYLENGVRNSNYNTSYSYDKHGNILTLNRRGNTNATGFGDIDKLTMSYQGNQLLKVGELAAAPHLSTSISMDFRKGSTQAIQYFYDKNGNLVKDLNKGIGDIQYNSLNLPGRLSISGSQGSGTNTYIYSADGRKLNVTAKWGTSSSKNTDYVGNIIYENGSLKRILVNGGYIEGGIYHFYLTDHLGNNRVVAKGDGTIVQSTHYYPFGMSFADGITTSSQPYKFGNKELDTDRGLNWYDFSARFKTVDILAFTTMDPLAEKYYSISPYAYCANNPMRFVDPTGMFVGNPLIQPFQRIPYGGNALSNAYSFVYNTGAAICNTPIGVVNQLVSEAQYIGDNGVGAYLSSGANNAVDGVKSGIDYIVEAPISQKMSDFGTVLSNPETWENVAAGAALMAMPLKGTGTTGAATTTGSTPSIGSVSPNVQKALNTLNDIKANGATVQVNNLKPQFMQELNLTIKDGKQILNVRVETHAVQKKFGGNGTSPQRHLNVELQPPTIKLPNRGHKFLDNE